ncbi:MAG TPA: DUF4258 domain-containing protein [Spirochaetota bacterium]|nr:DUF4258 domain-containing protein [Spirochaetota bacterium]HPU87635.1 DUF4258 domain-containing protein [Spirochaetota bacterium]
MSSILKNIVFLVEQRQVFISYHGYDELSNDSISVLDVINGIKNAVLIQEYPEYRKGPCVLVLQSDSEGNPIHVVWGMSKGDTSTAVLVTAYRPDPERWTDGFTRRKE